MAKRLKGIRTGAGERRAAGMRTGKSATGRPYDEEAQQHVKGKASKMGVEPPDTAPSLKKGIKARLKAESEMGITRGAKAWGGRRFNKQTDPVKR